MRVEQCGFPGTKVNVTNKGVNNEFRANSLGVCALRKDEFRRYETADPIKERA
jgi:hypothetical protein